MGTEYEAILRTKLRQAGLSFVGEEDLKDEGRAKTPDVRLLTPFGSLRFPGVHELFLSCWVVRGELD